MSTTYKEDIERKLATIWRFVGWAIAFLLSLSICLPGIFISIQYSSDECVKGTGNINLALDRWLLLACIFVLSYMIIVLIFICTGVKDRIFKVIWIIVHLLQIVWYSIGIYLIINSTLKCKHNSLWQMSVAYCSVTGAVWVIETFWIISKWSNRRCCTKNVCLEFFKDNDETYYFQNPRHEYQSIEEEEEFDF